MAPPTPPPPAATPSGSSALRLALVALFVGVVVAFFALGGHRYLIARRDQGEPRRAARVHAGAFRRVAGDRVRGLRRRDRVQPARRPRAVADDGLRLRPLGRHRAGRRRRDDRRDARVPGGALHVRRRGAHGGWARWASSINAGFTENAFSYLLFLRLVPLFPFFLVNLAPAFTSIPLRTYVLATFDRRHPGHVRVREPRPDARAHRVAAGPRLGGDAGRVRAARRSFALVPVAIRKHLSRPDRPRPMSEPCRLPSRMNFARLKPFRPA